MCDSRIPRKSGIFLGRNGAKNQDENCERLKPVTRIELEQRHIIKLLHLKGLKLRDIAVELSSLSSQDADMRSSRKYWLHQLRLETKDLTRQYVGGRSPLDETDTKFDRSFGYLRFP
jgi:hypothetical protein